MTPLAYRIVKDMILPAHKRKFVDRCEMAGQMSDLHCFEVTEIYDAVVDVMGAGVPIVDGRQAIPEERMAKIASATSFLPAPKTWIEFGGAPGICLGFLLEEVDGFAIVQLACEDTNAGVFGSDSLTFGFGLGAKGADPGHYAGGPGTTAEQERLVGNYVGALNGILAFINSPRIVGREDHPPHRGLERKVKASLGARTDFKFQPWSEIKLAVTPPEDAGLDGAAGERLTGARALHFCRSHLRLRNGRLEMVRAHWRGDPAAGVKQSSYKVVP